MFSSDYFDRRVEEIISAISQKNKIIYSSISYAYKSGGKRIRPRFCLLCSELIKDNSQQDDEKITLSSICVELLHTASLMLDDVVDNSNMRRGLPSVNAVFGNKLAVISASYLIGLISKIISDLGNIDLVKKFSETSKLMAEGEALEFNIMLQTTYDLSRNFILENYFEVIKKKTSSLFSLSAVIPSIIYSKTEYLDLFAELGTLTGMAFQIKDDILDFTSDKIGKPSMKDLKEGKLTLPIILSDHYDSVVNIMKKYVDEGGFSIPDPDAEKIYYLVLSGGGIEKAEKYLESVFNQIQEILEKDIFKRKKEDFGKFIKFIVERDF